METSSNIISSKSINVNQNHHPYENENHLQDTKKLNKKKNSKKTKKKTKRNHESSLSSSFEPFEKKYDNHDTQNDNTKNHKDPQQMKDNSEKVNNTTHTMKKRKLNNKAVTTMTRTNDNSNTTIATDAADAAAKTTDSKHILNGIIVAISTLDIQGQTHSNTDTSYKSVMKKSKGLGATVTGQVHKRVHFVLSSRTTIQKQHLTQRLRKAIKKKIPILDLQWLHDCEIQQQRIVDYAPYDLTPLAIQAQQEASSTDEKRSDAKSQEQEQNHNDEEIEIDEYAGWSEPQEFGCCCVCHENGDDNCKWCINCSITLLQKQKKKNSPQHKGASIDVVPVEEEKAENNEKKKDKKKKKKKDHKKKKDKKSSQ